jgi:hypothetical protein
MALAGTALTFFSIFRVQQSAPLVSFRHAETWKSVETLRIVMPGFPTTAFRPPRTIDPLSTFYAQLAAGDAVRRVVLRDGPLKGQYSVGAKVAVSRPRRCDPTLVQAVCLKQNTAASLLEIDGLASTEARARQVAARVALAFSHYVRRQQDAAHIPTSSRVRLELVSARGTDRISGHGVVLPLLTFAVVAALLLVAGVSTRSRPVDGD